MNQNHSLQIFEFSQRIIGCSGRISSLFAEYSDAYIRFLYHADVIRTCIVYRYLKKLEFKLEQKKTNKN
jgi:hypothetical protein